MDECEPQRRSANAATPNWFQRAAEEAGRLDLAVYSAVAETPTPSLDRVLGRLSEAANYSAPVDRLGCRSLGRRRAAGARCGHHGPGVRGGNRDSVEPWGQIGCSPPAPGPR